MQELAEQFALTDKEVTLINRASTGFGEKTLTPTITDRVEKLYTDHGVHLALNEMVTELHKLIRVSRLQPIKATIPRILQFYVPLPSEHGSAKYHLDTLPNGAVITNAYMQTSDPTFSRCW